MFPSKMEILMAIALTTDSGKKLLTRPMDVTGEYTGHLCEALVRRSYTEGNHLRGYRLTPKGRQTLFGFVHKSGTGIKDIIIHGG